MFPVFFVLSHKNDLSTTQIARIIGHSRPSVSQIVTAMTRKGLVQSRRRATDGRTNVIALTAAGRALVAKIEDQYADVTSVVEELLSQTTHNLWDAIEEMERLLDERDLYTRVRAHHRTREAGHVDILDFTDPDAADFKRLNCEWIEEHFRLDHQDLLALDHPRTYILKPGGSILMARYKDEVVGTCALIKIDGETYELAKMAVTKTARGKGIGRLLGQAVIARARELGAKRVVLDSNTILEPAINLYRQLGFNRASHRLSPYTRCNIQMELRLPDVVRGKTWKDPKIDANGQE